MSGTEPVREWVGGRLTLPAQIESMGDRRAEMSLWVELPGLQVVGQVLEDPQDPQGTFGQSLMRAMASPLVGEPRRPQRVRVADPTLAEELKGFSFLSVEVGPTPEFDSVVRSLGAFFGEGSYFSDPTLVPEHLEPFFRAASDLFATKPWTMVDDDALVHIDVPSMGIHDGCVSIVGSYEEVRGFVLFPSYEDYERMTEGADHAEPGEQVAAYRALFLSFDPRDDLPETMREEVAEHGFPLADEDAYPVLTRLVDGQHAPVFEPEVRLATAVMRALAAFVLRHPKAFESYGDVQIRESQFDERDTEVILSIPHPLATPDRLPPPRAETLSAHNPYGLPLEAPALKALERTLGTFTLHRALGVFCAVASVPRLPPPNVWLGEIMQEVKVANEEHARTVIDQLMGVYNHVVSTLEDEGIDELIPEAADVEACRNWASGYAFMLGGVDRAQLQGEVVDAVFAIQAVAEIPPMLKLLDQFRGEDSRETMLARYRESLADDADFLFETWAEARTRPPETTVQRSAPKVGRNDPCPCGSGKKSKKCCASA